MEEKIDMIEPHFAYSILCALYGAVWLLLYALRSDTRRELLIVSFFAAPLGFTEWIYWMDYFRPVWLIPIFSKVGVEDIIWTALVSGIGAIVYEIFAKRRTYHSRNLAPNWLSNVWLSAVLMGGGYGPLHREQRPPV